MIRLILIAYVITNVASDICPDDCFCLRSEEGQRLVHSMTCKVIPYEIPPHAVFIAFRNIIIPTLTKAQVQLLERVKMLNFQGLDIEVIEDNALDNMPELQMLKLADNKLTRIGNSTFSRCLELTDLNLEMNRLKYIATDAFGQLIKLQILRLSNNNLQQLPPILPASLTEFYADKNFLNELPYINNTLTSLEHLDLCGNNYLTYSIQNFNAPNLGYLCIGDRVTTVQNLISYRFTMYTLEIKSKQLLLSQISSFIYGLDSLENLILNSISVDSSELNFTLHKVNMLQMLHISSVTAPPNLKLFQAFPNLKMLDLHRSEKFLKIILGVDSNLKDLGHISQLAISETNTQQITELQGAGLNSLTSLDLSLNPLHCDCNLTWLVQRIKTKSLALVHEEYTTCSTPDNYSGRKVTELRMDNCTVEVNTNNPRSIDKTDPRQVYIYETYTPEFNTSIEELKNGTNQTIDDAEIDSDDDKSRIQLIHVFYTTIGLGVLIVILISLVIALMCSTCRRRPRRQVVYRSRRLNNTSCSKRASRPLSRPTSRPMSIGVYSCYDNEENRKQATVLNQNSPDQLPETYFCRNSTSTFQQQKPSIIKDGMRSSYC